MKALTFLKRWFPMRSLIASKSLLLILTLCFYSCTDPRYSRADEKVQKFRAELNKQKTAFEQIDTTELNGIARKVKLGVDSLELMAVEEKWTLDKEEAEFLTNYKAISEPASSLSKKAQILYSDMLYSEKQLATLQTDIQNQAQPIDSILKYLNNEEQALNTIKSSTKNMVEGNEVLIARYELLDPQYSYFVDRIVNRK